MRKDTRKHKHALLGIASLISSSSQMLRYFHLISAHARDHYSLILKAGDDDDAARER